MSLDELLRETISLHTPLTAETFQLFDREAFALCQRQPIIINTARGVLNDTDTIGERWMRELSMEQDSMFSKESGMRKDADQIVTHQIIAHPHNAACREPGKRTPEGIKPIERLFRNQRLLSRSDVVFASHVDFNSVEAVERMLAMTVDNIRAFSQESRLTSSQSQRTEHGESFLLQLIGLRGNARVTLQDSSLPRIAFKGFPFSDLDGRLYVALYILKLRFSKSRRR